MAPTCGSHDVSRPLPPTTPVEGHEYVAEPEGDDWRADNSGRRCRMIGSHANGRRACGKPCVARLNRGMNKRGGRHVPSWWHYCADHLYGRWVEDGVVMHWILRPSGVVPADNARGWVRPIPDESTPGIVRYRPSSVEEG